MELLWKAVQVRLGDSVLYTGHHLASFHDDGNAVHATFCNRRTGSTVSELNGLFADWCDGIHSEFARRSIRTKESRSFPDGCFGGQSRKRLHF